MRMRVVDCGGALLCELVAEAGWTVRDVKVAVQREVGISRHAQRLCYDSAELPDHDLVSDALRHCSADGDEDAELLVVQTSPEWASWHESLDADGSKLQGAPDWVASDPKLVLTAVVQHPPALAHAAAKVRNDRDFVLDALELDLRVLDVVVRGHVESLAEDRILVTSALQLARALDVNCSRQAARLLLERHPMLAGEAAQAPSSGGSVAAAGATAEPVDDDGDAFGLGVIGAGLSATAAAGAYAGAATAAGVIAGDGALVAAAGSVGIIAAEGSALLGSAGATALGSGLVAASSIAGFLALPLLGGFAVSQLVPGIPAGEVTLSVRRALGTCRVRSASVVWLVEDTWGQVHMYHFRSRAEAHARTREWTSARILFDFSGFLSRERALEEIGWQGPTWPRSTIRKAASRLNDFCRLPGSVDGFL